MANKILSTTGKKNDFCEKYFQEHTVWKDKHIEDIYFFEVNTKYISSCVLKTSEFS